jgi:hypothetical protein
MAVNSTREIRARAARYADLKALPPDRMAGRQEGYVAGAVSELREWRRRRVEVRRAFADFEASCGCGCCAVTDVRADAERRLAALLEVPPFADKSGFAFGQYRTRRGG